MIKKLFFNEIKFYSNRLLNIRKSFYSVAFVYTNKFSYSSKEQKNLIKSIFVERNYYEDHFKIE